MCGLPRHGEKDCPLKKMEEMMQKERAKEERGAVARSSGGKNESEDSEEDGSKEDGSNSDYEISMLTLKLREDTDRTGINFFSFSRFLLWVNPDARIYRVVINR